MEITLPISSLIIISIGSVGVIISLLAAGYNYSKNSRDQIPNKILSVLLLVCGLTLLNETLNTSGITNRIKQLYFIPISYSLSIAPLFYLFVKTKFNNKFQTIDWIHLIIPIIQAIVYWSVGFQSVSFKSTLWQTDWFRTYLMIESFLFPLGIVLYSILSLMILRKKIDNNYFWNEDLRTWLFTLTKIFIIIAGIELSVSIGEYYFGLNALGLFTILRMLIFLSFILWFSFNAIQLSNPLTIYQSKPKTAKPAIDSNELDQLKDIIISLMETDKVYLNSDLTIQILAEYAGTTVKKCSYVLSQGLNTNFNRFINKYRVEAFKNKVLEHSNQNFTLLSIAYDCGFESKSTFNRAFKNLTGSTPSQYLEALNSKK